MIAREKKRVKMIQKYSVQRKTIKEKIEGAKTLRDRMQAQEMLQKMPRDASPVRHKRRCQQCERPRSVYRRFGLCRICLRYFLMKGDVPGGKKASW